MWPLLSLWMGAAPPADRTPDPQFSGSAEDVALARRAWALATACAGRPAFGRPVVPLIRDLPVVSGPSLAGLTRLLDGVMVDVHLRADATPDVLAHEIGHAWIHEGPRGLQEGRTELLALCVQQKDPDTFGVFREADVDLARLTDITTWDAAVRGSDQDDQTIFTHYVVGFRLLRLLAEVVGAGELLRPEVTGWEQVTRLVEAQGERGAALLALLRGGVEVQRRELGDGDLDGLMNIEEAPLGLDPTRWDTDGDGWWDGATEKPAGAQPFPRDGSPLCLAAVPAGAGLVPTRLGGRLAGENLVNPTPTTVDRGTLFSWTVNWDTRPGGVWLLPMGEGLTPNPRCASRPGLVARANVDVPAGVLDRLAGAVQRESGRLLEQTKVPASKVVLTVSAGEGLLVRENPPFGVRADWRTVRVPVSWLTGDIDALALQVAALGLVPDRSRVGQGQAAALAHLLGAAATPALDAAPYDWRPWLKEAERCDTGWTGVLEKRCGAAAPVTTSPDGRTRTLTPVER